MWHETSMLAEGVHWAQMEMSKIKDVKTGTFFSSSQA